MNQVARIDSVALLDRDMAAKNLSGYWRLGMEGLPPSSRAKTRVPIATRRRRCASLFKAAERTPRSTASSVSWSPAI